MKWLEEESDAYPNEIRRDVDAYVDFLGHVRGKGTTVNIMTQTSKPDHIDFSASLIFTPDDK